MRTISHKLPAGFWEKLPKELAAENLRAFATEVIAAQDWYPMAYIEMLDQTFGAHTFAHNSVQNWLVQMTGIVELSGDYNVIDCLFNWENSAFTYYLLADAIEAGAFE